MTYVAAMLQSTIKAKNTNGNFLNDRSSLNLASKAAALLDLDANSGYLT